MVLVKGRMIMAENYTKEQLDTMSRKELVQAVLAMQEGFSAMQKKSENNIEF